MGIHLLRVQFSTNLSSLSTLSTIFTIFIPRFASYIPFLDQPIEEKSKREKSIEAMQEAERKFQASPIPQYFHDSYSVPPVQNKKSSILKMNMRESEQQSQNLMDSRFHHKFQNKTLSF